MGLWVPQVVKKYPHPLLITLTGGEHTLDFTPFDKSGTIKGRHVIGIIIPLPNISVILGKGNSAGIILAMFSVCKLINCGFN